MISMNKTYTPELAPEILHRLRDYAGQFRDLYRHAPQFAWSGVYLRGLLEDRVGVAGPGAPRGPVAWPPGDRRRGLRGRAGAARRPGPAGAVLHRGSHLGDGGLHRGTAVGATRPLAGRPTADLAPVGRGRSATHHAGGTGPAPAPPESHLA